MAFAMNSEAQLMFFSKVFGPTHNVTVKAKSLLDTGVQFELALYTVKATWKGKLFSVGLTKGTTTLMKGAVEPAIAEQNKVLIADWMHGLVEKVFGKTVATLVEEQPSVSEMAAKGASIYQKPPQEKNLGFPVVLMLMATVQPPPNMLVLIKAIQTVTGKTLLEAKKIAEAVIAGTPQALKVLDSKEEAEQFITTIQGAGGMVKYADVSTLQKPAEKPKIIDMPNPFDSAIKATKGVTQAFDEFGKALGKTLIIDKVIDLKDAQAVGQKVHGTSAGSVYHTIAISEHVRVAARLYQGGSISIRAEWTDSPTAELKKLADAGVNLKTSMGYGSIHFDAAEVPIQRVIGAFLIGTGIAWKQAVMNGAELVITEKM